MAKYGERFSLTFWSFLISPPIMSIFLTRFFLTIFEICVQKWQNVSILDKKYNFVLFLSLHSFSSIYVAYFLHMFIKGCENNCFNNSEILQLCHKRLLGELQAVFRSVDLPTVVYLPRIVEKR